jgi:CRISPR-associated protein Cas1
VRYADDFVVLAKSRKHIERARELTEDTLERLELRLHANKTRIVRYDQGFKFLGVVFLNDMLLQPLPSARKQLRVLSSARPIPEPFFLDKEKRPLRRYRAF